jgi:hypothetical protein
MLSATSVAFDDPNLVASAGLVPVLALASRCGLHESARTSLTVPSPNAAVKVAAVVAGMVVGADSIDDLDRLRHGGMGRLFSGIRAPSTLGTFLRSFTFGHVKQLDKVAATVLVNLAGDTPLLRDVDQLCWVDVDDTVKHLRVRQAGRRLRLHRRQRVERAGRGAVHTGVGAGDRGDPAPERLDQQPARRRLVCRRHLGDGEAVWSVGVGRGPARLRVLRR